MIEGVENGDERIDRLVAELAAYGVIDAQERRGEKEGREKRGGEEERRDGADVGNGESGGTGGRSGSTGGAEGSRGERALESVFAGPRAGISFEEGIVKQNLEAILLGLISVRGGAHGKALMGDLDRFFDAQLSPGTVYPRLHDLEAEGALRAHELVRTKEYTIADETHTRERIERAMGQHVALGAVFRSALGHAESAAADRR